MSRVLVTVQDGAIQHIDSDNPATIVFVRTGPSKIFDGSAERYETTYLRPEELDVMLLAGELQQEL